VAPTAFGVAATEWLKRMKPSLAENSLRVDQVNIDDHLRPAFGTLVLIDTSADDIADYQRSRLKEGA
jgi:hypothetical protein